MYPDSLKASRRVFSATRFDVHEIEVPGRRGRTFAWQLAVMADAVAVLPLLDDDRVVLIRNRRLAVGETLWEVPAGTVEPGEVPDHCADRELIEETGYRAGRMRPLLTFFPSPGVCTERMHVFVADDLEPVAEGQALEENEHITVEVLPWERSMQMISDGTIRDGKTIATLLYYQALDRKRD